MRTRWRLRNESVVVEPRVTTTRTALMGCRARGIPAEARANAQTQNGAKPLKKLIITDSSFFAYRLWIMNYGFGFRVRGLGFRISCATFRSYTLGLGFKVSGFESNVYSF